MKKVFLVFLVLSFFSCAEKEKTNTPSKFSYVKNQNVDKVTGVENAQKWLTKTLTDYFKVEKPDASLITTPEYYEYKDDAINIDLDVEGALSKNQFEEKWGKVFDIKYVGLNTGFFIDGQDFGEIVVQKCDPIKVTDAYYWFNVVLEDKQFKQSYEREIKVVKSDDSFLIADVKE